MSNEDKSTITYFYPSCQVKGCGGILKFHLNEDKLCVDYECEKNRDHHDENIYFKSFENFYLKESKEKVYKCSKCFSIIYKDKIYKCKECKNIYCENCKHFDEHSAKDINNIMIVEENLKREKMDYDKKCPKCKNNICFCFECLQNICIYCSKFHKKHQMASLSLLSQTQESINHLLDKIEEKSKINENLICSIDKWEKEIQKKVETLKQKLRDEISLLKKLALNFNPLFDEPVYCLNFWELFFNLKNINMNDIKKFDGTYGLEEQSKYIMKLFFQKEFKIENKIGFIERNIEENHDTILHRLDDKNYIVYEPYDYTKEVHNNFGLKTFSKEYLINLGPKIYSISSSKDKKEIYACLSDWKRIIIFNCDLDLFVIEKSNIEIVEENLKYKEHFNKCIQISSENLATSDNEKISIWSKIIDDEQNEKKYINILNINFNTNVLDILSVNNEYFISCQPENRNISFVNIYSLEQEKILYDNKFQFYLDSKNVLTLLNKYIGVNCLSGIFLIYTKTKEIVQFIENKISSKFICLNHKDSFFIINPFNFINKEDIFVDFIVDNTGNFDLRLYLWGSIEKYNLIDGCFERVENYRQIYSKFNSNNLNSSNLICINNTFICGIQELFLIEEISFIDVQVSPYDNLCYKVLIKKNNLKNK